MKNRKLNDKKTETYYSFIGESHIEDLIDSTTEEIDFDMSEMDDWFDGFIDNYEKKIKSDKRKKSFIRISKIAAVLIAVLSMSFSGLFVGVEAFRATILNKIIGENDTHLVVGNSNYDQLIELNIKVPEELPINFALVSYEEIGSMKKTHYENSHDEFITITQSHMETNVQLDSENAYVELLKSNNIEVVFIEKNKIVTCYWEEEGKSFSLISNLNKSQILKIINSMK